MSTPHRGATVSMTGPGGFENCVGCGRLILVNQLAWGADFAGDRGGTMRVKGPICSTCVRPDREARAQNRAGA